MLALELALKKGVAVAGPGKLSYKRMNDSTPAALLQAAHAIFAERGFQASSIRAITAAAGANLGAVTYHFGSKEALYHAVLDSATTGVRERVRAAAEGDGTALDRIERVVRALFHHMAEHPELPRLMLHVLTLDATLPPAIERTMRGNIGLLAELVRAGQAAGQIRDGDAQHLAMNTGGAVIFLALLRNALQQAVGLDQDDPATRRNLLESVADFIRHGLARPMEDGA